MAVLSFYNSNYHQVYQVMGQYYSYGAWIPQYGWVNCPTCGGDGKLSVHDVAEKEKYGNHIRLYNGH